MVNSKASLPQESDFSGWEAYRPLDTGGHLQVLHIFGWWEKYPKLRRSSILKDAHHRLVKAGADPSFATKILTILTEAPCLRRWQAMCLAGVSPEFFKEFDQRAELIEELEARLQPLKALTKAPMFASYSLALQIQVMTELLHLSKQYAALHTAQFEWYLDIVQRHPLFVLLDREAGIPIRKSRPPMLIANLFMVLLTDHLFERTGKRHYLDA